MERKEQIYKAAQQYSDSMDEFQRYHTYPKAAFIYGAKWADEHPNNKENIENKQEQYIEKKYLVLIYGKIRFKNNFILYYNKKDAINRAKDEYDVMVQLQAKYPNDSDTPTDVELVCLDNCEPIDFLKEE